MTHREVTVAELPPRLRDVAELSSVAAAVAFSRAFGGREVYVPERPAPGHPIAEVIGEEAARALSRTWGGDYIYVPQLGFLERHQRDAAIIEAWREGEPVRAVALRHGVSERQARRICAREGKHG